VLLLSTQANAAGLTLTAANNLLVLDVTLNLEDELQLLHRIHRIGQTRPVNIFR
jgi:SNF2 family DNA or RNA helicase